MKNHRSSTRKTRDAEKTASFLSEKDKRFKYYIEEA